MKTVILMVTWGLAGYASALALDYSTISPEEIAETAAHLDRLLHDAQAKTATVQARYDGLHAALATETLRADSEAARADREATRADLWEHRTEVVVEIFAVGLALWIGSLFSGEIVRDWPAPWSFFAVGVVYGAAFFSSMWVINHFIDLIGHVIPTIPSWHEATRWFHHAAPALKKEF